MPYDKRAGQADCKHRNRRPAQFFWLIRRPFRKVHRVGSGEKKFSICALVRRFSSEASLFRTFPMRGPTCLSPGNQGLREKKRGGQAIALTGSNASRRSIERLRAAGPPWVVRRRAVASVSLQDRVLLGPSAPCEHRTARLALCRPPSSIGSLRGGTLASLCGLWMCLEGEPLRGN